MHIMRPLLVPCDDETMQTLLTCGAAFIWVYRIDIVIPYGISMMLGWLALHWHHVVMRKLASFFFFSQFPPKMVKNECRRYSVLVCLLRLLLVKLPTNIQQDVRLLLTLLGSYGVI